MSHQAESDRVTGNGHIWPCPGFYTGNHSPGMTRTWTCTCTCRSVEPAAVDQLGQADVPLERAEAVVLIWTADGQALGEPFDGPDCLSIAHAFAEDLRERNDFPGALICATGNKAAGRDRRNRLIHGITPPPAGEARHG